MTIAQRKLLFGAKEVWNIKNVAIVFEYYRCGDDESIDDVQPEDRTKTWYQKATKKIQEIRRRSDRLHYEGHIHKMDYFDALNLQSSWYVNELE